jgi:hypothetical protein
VHCHRISSCRFNRSPCLFLPFSFFFSLFVLFSASISSAFCCPPAYLWTFLLPWCSSAAAVGTRIIPYFHLWLSPSLLGVFMFRSIPTHSRLLKFPCLSASPVRRRISHVVSEILLSAKDKGGCGKFIQINRLSKSTTQQLNNLSSRCIARPLDTVFLIDRGREPLVMKLLCVLIFFSVQLTHLTKQILGRSERYTNSVWKSSLKTESTPCIRFDKGKRLVSRWFHVRPIFAHCTANNWIQRPWTLKYYKDFAYEFIPPVLPSDHRHLTSQPHNETDWVRNGTASVAPFNIISRVQGTRERQAGFEPRQKSQFERYITDLSDLWTSSASSGTYLVVDGPQR